VVEFLVRNNATDSTILQCVKCNSNIHTLPNDTKQLSSVWQKCVERRSAGAQRSQMAPGARNKFVMWYCIVQQQ